MLQADDAAGLRRLARLVAQRNCPDGVVDWLRAHVMTETRYECGFASASLTRVSAAERRVAEERKAAVAARAARTAEDLAEERGTTW